MIGDEQLLARLNRFVQDIHLQRRPGDFRPTDLQELAGWYKSVLEQPAAAWAWVAEEASQPLGYVLAILHRHPETPFTRARVWLEIDQIAVDPDHRRRGIGRALMLTVMAAAKAEGIEKVEAVSWSFNDETHEVFRRLGLAPKTVRFELRERA